jgi:large subunit ribosomal protein L10
MARPEKEAAVEEMAEILQKANGVFITDFTGLNVEKMTELRCKCREASVSYRVVKNTLARLAAKKAGREEMVAYFDGPSALAFSYDDPSAPARIIAEFAKKIEKPTIKVSLFEGVFYGPERVQEIASLPSKQVLLSQLVGGLNAPIYGFAATLNGLLQKVALVFNAIKNSKE